MSRPVAGIPYLQLGLIGCVVLAVGIGIFAYVIDDGDRDAPARGGEPFAVAAIETAPKVEAQVRAPAPPRAPAAGRDADVTGTIAPAKRSATGEQVEAQSGVRIFRGGNAAAPGAMIIEVPRPLSVHLSPAPDRRLVEKDRYGMLPKVGADGARPADVYARPVMTSAALKPGAPRIALLIGGMGLNEAATTEATTRLPAEVSLGFAPYGDALDRQVARAREAGHEVILQLPMEGFGDVGANAMPHALLAAAEPAENLDRLHWMMSRFVGYIGVANFLGAKLTADEAAFTPILREISTRGLVFVDDGSSPRSLTGALASEIGLPAVRADVVVDAATDAASIDAALASLEKLARDRGLAVGVASGLPATIDAVGRFASGLEARGIALVPVGAAVTGTSRASASRSSP